MKITKIDISNYRSIKSQTIVCDRFTVFIGQNNSGKTNCFEAIEWFYNGPRKGEDVQDLTHFRNDTETIRVTISFSGVQHGIDKMTNEKNKETIKKIVGDADTISVYRDSTEPKKRLLIIGDDVPKLPGTGFDAALNDFLPRFEYVHTKQYHNDVAKYKQNSPIANMLSGVIDEMLKSNRKWVEFTEKFNEIFKSDDSDVSKRLNELGKQVQGYLDKQFPDTKSVGFSIAPPSHEDFLKSFETEIDDGIMTSVEEKGDGMQRALMLAVVQAYADHRRRVDSTGKSFVFFIDEAELHLHPLAQRKLKAALLELAAKNDQVFINTHSSVLISDKNTGQLIYSVEKTNGITEFDSVTDEKHSDVVFDLLGGSPADLRFPSNLLIVEGPAEAEFLRHVILRHYQDKPKIQVIPARGDAYMVQKIVESLQKIYDILKNPIYFDRFVIVTDKQPATAVAAMADFTARYPALKSQRRLTEINENSLEEAYPAPWKTDSPANKVKLAKRVAISISKEQFESEMSGYFQSLCRCWDLAYK